MKAAVYRGSNDVVLHEWPIPTIGPGELLLRLRGCGLCGSDVAKITTVGPAPTVFGHEVVGDVVEVGAGVTAFAPGDRVAAAHHVPCFACHYCRRGSASMCPGFKASNLDPGGFAEFIRVPAPHVGHVTFKIPVHVSDEAASFIESLGCCVRAARRAAVRAGDTAVVVGLGSIGCLFVQLLQRAGARVVACDPVPERVDFGKRLGADAYRAADAAVAHIRELTDGRGADVTIITGGGTAVLPWAVECARDGGAIHYFAGGAGAELPLALESLYHRELTLTATYSSSPADLAEAFELIVGGRVAVEPLVSHRLPLAEVGRGAELMRQRAALKVFIVAGAA